MAALNIPPELDADFTQLCRVLLQMAIEQHQTLALLPTVAGNGAVADSPPATAPERGR